METQWLIGTQGFTMNQDGGMSSVVVITSTRTPMFKWKQRSDFG
jgi:hypothetical protein